MNGLPIITLEVMQMKQTINTMLTAHTAMLDEQVKLALDAAVTPASIEGVIRRTVQSCVDEAVTQEIQQFFRYSDSGRKAIREAVLEHLETHFGDKP